VNNWFGPTWWSGGNWRWNFAPNTNWWAWATWPTVSTWIPTANWSQPIYYNFGNNVWVQNDTVFFGDQPVATTEEFANQAEQIATSIPDVEPAPEDWMPLGVFAMTPSDEDDEDIEPSLFLQLAVSKQGIISGSLQNTTANTVKAIEGMVDKQTQRAAWTEVGQTRPIMEAGISNLTQDTTPVLVHFADGSIQQWLLVRLDRPSGSREDSSPPVPATPPQ
jgi:hypothetical protein